VIGCPTPGYGLHGWASDLCARFAALFSHISSDSDAVPVTHQSADRIWLGGGRGALALCGLTPTHPCRYVHFCFPPSPAVCRSTDWRGHHNNSYRTAPSAGFSSALAHPPIPLEQQRSGLPRAQRAAKALVEFTS